MDRRLLFIINPISGIRNKQSLQELIREEVSAADLDYVIYPSVASGDYSYLNPIIKKEKITDIVIAGGDGTINQAIAGLNHHHLPFGILPLGSGNGLAFTAGIPKNIRKAIRIALAGKSEETDAFLVNDQFACMLVGLGFDAQVAHDFANDPKRGLTTYVKKTISNFIKAKTYPFILHCQGKEIRTNALFISIANSNQFGNNFTIAPRASLSDGLLDVVIMAKQNRFLTLVEAMKQISGFNDLQSLDVLDERAHLLYFQTRDLSISNTQLAPMHVDGDPVASHRKINIKMLKGYFRLIKP
jgi:diacylglycerol kinase (ATP)